ncbi:MAG: hypothetical protein IH997_11185 [Proteobacteria bacterium]|nr:hypothetical protein [Pseudomonadota bacterium]
MRRSLLLGACVALAACSSQPQPRQPASGATPVLRVLYRDDAHGNAALMLLTQPSGLDGPRPSRDCAAPLLIDPVTGAAHALGPQEVAARLRTMRIVGATPGTCENKPVRDAALRRM